MSRKKINHWLRLSVLVVPLTFAVPAMAAQNKQPRQGFLGEPRARSGPTVSLQQAIDIALQENGGRVLSAQSRGGKSGQSPRHHIRLLLDGGRVLNLVVDDRGRLQKTR